MRAIAVFFLLVGSAFADPELVNQINKQRQQYNLPKVSYNEQLASAAQSQAEWMAQTGKMEHLRGSEAKSFEEWKQSDYHPVNRIIHSGYFQWQDLFSLQNNRLMVKPGANDQVGEVVAYGAARSGNKRYNPAVIANGWMHSAGHRKILTKNFDDVGVGYYEAPNGAVYWCAVFGRK